MKGVLLLLCLALLYGTAYRFYKNKQYYYVLAFIIIAGFACRMFCATDPILHHWDERYHALVAKNMIESPLAPMLYQEPLIDYDYKDWRTNHIWMHKQPFALWSMALSMKLFGSNEIVLRLPSVFLSTLSIVVLFFLAFILYNKRIALLTAFFLSINGHIIETTAGRITTDHIDTSYSFWILMAIFFVVLQTRKRNRLHLISIGVCAGIAILTKWLPALIVLPLYAVLNYKELSIGKLSQDLILLFFIIAIVAIPWQWFAYIQYPLEYAWEQAYNSKHLFEALEGHGQSWWFFIDRIRVTINELIYLIMIWYLYQCVKEKAAAREYFILCWIGIPFIFFSFAATKMQGYLLFTYPAYFIITALFVAKMIDKIKEVKKNQWKWVYRILALAVVILSFRLALERVKPFKTNQKKKQLKEQLINTNLPANAVLFNMPCYIEFMFYNDVMAYPSLPEPNQIEQLLRDEHLIFIVDNNQLPEHIIENKQLQILQINADLSLCY